MTPPNNPKNRQLNKIKYLIVNNLCNFNFSKFLDNWQCISCFWYYLVIQNPKNIRQDIYAFFSQDQRFDHQ
ncbi:MAG: hypothetical protein BGO48_00095 [Mucilaginibacter sp. 44-25]|nr:MAG: hypothetical protein BGO48_00095 [Mucilaginibacter sp. 44-25]